MTLILSFKALEQALLDNGVKPKDLARIDQLFGGADGYYWYQTLRQMCEDADEDIHWPDEDAMRRAVQAHENASAAEDEVKPQALTDSHAAAIAGLLARRG